MRRSRKAKQRAVLSRTRTRRPVRNATYTTKQEDAEHYKENVDMTIEKWKKSRKGERMIRSINARRGKDRERAEDNVVTDKRETGTEKRGGRAKEDREKKVRDDDEVDTEEAE